MSVKACIESYKIFLDKVFDPKKKGGNLRLFKDGEEYWDAAPLEAAVKDVIKKSGLGLDPETAKLRDPASDREGACKM